MKTVFKIEYHTRWGESLCLMAGDSIYPMEWTPGDIWTVTIDFQPRTYGYAVMEDGLVKRSEWTDHSLSGKRKSVIDRWIDCPIEGCPFTRKHSAGIFDTPGFRGAGTAVPVFSLRSSDDFGIGDFRDLHLLTDWTHRTGQTVIQLLPVNDTTRQGGWKDSYPYSPISSFALHPLFIRLQDVGVKPTADFLDAQKRLNSLDELDYPQVYREKMRFLKEAFASNGKRDLKSPGYLAFSRENSFWLDEYAVFCSERDSDSPAEFYKWVQYHLDRQLSEEVQYAHSLNIHFKGDLPIGVSADSVEARFHPELFNLDSSAGAPPDFFSKDGQNWGFPTYNWDAMAADGYAWWRRRLRKMARHFDAFRIDHILGFFRIWEIPVSFKSGAEGHFNPALPYSGTEISAAGLPVKGLFNEDPRNPGMWQPRISPDLSGLTEEQRRVFSALYDDFFFHRNDAFWRRNAERKLPALLTATGMLACGEDLGMVPSCVDGVMRNERILSLEMPMMDKGRPWPYLSVCATSSHDMQTLRQQQASDPEPAECAAMLRGCLSSAPMLAIFPIQDWLSADSRLRRTDREAERINCPENPEHHWRYRLHLPLETLVSDDAEGLNSGIAAMLKDSGRFNG